MNEDEEDDRILATMQLRRLRPRLVMGRGQHPKPSRGIVSEINHFVMAITSAEATFWHYRFRQMARLPHVAGELIAHVKCDVADPGYAWVL
jgi:hypothetical protein